jgi:hypothetical protein
VARNRFSPGAVVLVKAGTTLREVARALDEPPQRVSRELRGEAPVHPGLVPVVRALGGPAAASELETVLDLAGARDYLAATLPGEPVQIEDAATLDRAAAVVAAGRVGQDRSPA